MELTPDGYTRVSSILQIFQAYAHVPREKLKKAQDIGTDIHGAIEGYFNGDFPVIEDRKCGYFNSFLTWIDSYVGLPVLIEERLFDHSLKITGKVDLVVPIKKELTLVDFKTGSWAHPEIWKLQATFYRHLIKLLGEHPIPDKFLFLQLIKDGSAPILFEFEYDPSDWDICIAALRCYKYFSKENLCET